MKIVKSVVSVLCMCGLLAINACNNNNDTVVLGNWVLSPDYKGHPRAGAFSFTIGNTAYVGLGHDGLIYRHESYAFSSDSGFWKKIATFPGEVRERAVAFSVNGKGYVGTGYNRDSVVVSMKDFWEFDPIAGDSGTWTRLQDFPGAARYNAIAFTDGTFGYVGTGYDNDFYGDFYRFDPSNNTWKEIPDYPGRKRQQASIMNISGKVYLMGGTNNGSFLTDIWQFDPESQSWSNHTPLNTDAQYGNFKAAVNRYDAVTFTLSDRGYIATGSNGAYLNTIYQFDPVGLTWTKMTNFERAPRSAAISYVIDGKAYVGCGGNAGFRFDNVDEFRPLEDYNNND